MFYASPHLTMKELTAETAVLAAIHQRLDQPWCRLITLVGRRGSGKARLVATVARQRRARYADGTLVLVLTGLETDAAAPAQALAARIALALDLTPPTPRDALAHLLAGLQGNQMLLALVDFPGGWAGVDAVLGIVQGCAGVQVLVTAEAALGLRAEWLIPWDGG